ncbi:MAG TPA: O-antigen ligase family protein [Terriglobales bacterium]|jgi:O-antigen ligase
MNTLVASAICAFGIAGLFYLDREKAPRVSWALWLPGIWIGIVGSRPVSQWFGMQQAGNLGLDGSPFDAAVFGVVLMISIGVLIRRLGRTRVLLVANWPILIYFLFCLVSIMWSTHPDVSFKRWAKAIGDLAMALIIATDKAPVAAFRRLVSRVGMLLLPTSVLFIKYLGDLGRGYTSDGLPMNTGVTTNKNSLGLIVFVITLVVLWNIRSLMLHKDASNRGRRLIAQGILLAFGFVLLVMAQCSTCKACFVIGTLVVFILTRRTFTKRPARAHAVCLAILLLGGGSLFFGQADVASALGRQSSLSGRTDIWNAVIPNVPNPIIGAGFESFWNTVNAEKARNMLVHDAGFSPLVIGGLQEAHDGYIEIYLQLGWTGICLIGAVIITGYIRAYKAYRRDPELGSLFIAYVLTATFYSITEAGFRTMNPSWIFLLTAVVGSTSVTAGFLGRKKGRIAASKIIELSPETTLPTFWSEPDTV